MSKYPRKPCGHCGGAVCLVNFPKEEVDVHTVLLHTCMPVRVVVQDGVSHTQREALLGEHYAAQVLQRRAAVPDHDAPTTNAFDIPLQAVLEGEHLLHDGGVVERATQRSLAQVQVAPAHRLVQASTRKRVAAVSAGHVLQNIAELLRTPGLELAQEVLRNPCRPRKPRHHPIIEHLTPRCVRCWPWLVVVLPRAFALPLLRDDVPAFQKGEGRQYLRGVVFQDVGDLAQRLALANVDELLRDVCLLCVFVAAADRCWQALRGRALHTRNAGNHLDKLVLRDVAHRRKLAAHV